MKILLPNHVMGNRHSLHDTKYYGRSIYVVYSTDAMNILVTIPEGPVKESFMPSEVKKRINALGDVSWNETRKQYGQADIAGLIKGRDICITGWGSPMLDINVLDNADRLRLLVHTGGTVAQVANSLLYQRGIKVISGNRMFAESVAEGVLAYILCSLRDVAYLDSETKKGCWRTDHLTEGLFGKKVGLIGFGMVARYLVPMLRPFRVGIKVYDPYVTAETCAGYGVIQADLQEVIGTSDIISVHAPQILETYHLISREMLKIIPDGALFVNTSRGSLVDEKALCDELAKNRFRAVLDVYETEPLPQDSRLRGFMNVILSPHVAGPTPDRHKFITIELIDDIRRFIQGKAMKHEISSEYASMMTR